MYTLPFHFNSLFQLDEDLHSILILNPLIHLFNSHNWSSVKSIQLTNLNNSNDHSIKLIHIEMPKLTSITFSNHNQLKCNTTLNSVTTIQLNGTSLDNLRQWFIYRLPNVKHVVLYCTNMSTIDDELVQLFKRRIQRLTIHWYHNFQQLTRITNEYFSNVEFIDFWIGHIWQDPQPRARFLIHILRNLNNLKRLTIYFQCHDKRCEYSSVTELTQLISYLNLNEMKRYYHIKQTKSIFSCRKKSI